MSNIVTENLSVSLSSPLSLKGVSVTYGDVTDPVINDINLELKAGEVFGLMGLNGVGKTTMIKAVLGLREPCAGTISIFGDEKLSYAAKTRLSYLPEKFEPPWFLTGMEFMKFSLSLYKKPFYEQDVIDTANTLALDIRALGRRVHTYSKGMRQKLGLMGTMLTGCSLFILDEPMSGLDPRARALVKSMILDMRTRERTIFLSSHILADMDEICDRVALLHDGRIRYLGTPAALKEKMGKGYLEQAFLEFIERAG